MIDLKTINTILHHVAIKIFNYLPQIATNIFIDDCNKMSEIYI
jgi:hypothetical protein